MGQTGNPQILPPGKQSSSLQDQGFAGISFAHADFQKYLTEGHMQSICRTIKTADETIVFPRLLLDDISMVGEQVVSEREKIARQLAKEENLNMASIFNVVLDIRRTKPSWQDLVKLADVPEVTKQLLVTSLKKGGIKDNAEQMRLIGLLAAPDAIELAQQLIFDQQEEPTADDKKVELGNDPKNDVAAGSTSNTTPEKPAEPVTKAAEQIESKGFYGKGKKNN